MKPRLPLPATLLLALSVVCVMAASPRPATLVKATAKFTIAHLPLSQVDVPPRLIMRSPLAGLNGLQALQNTGENGYAVVQYIVDTHGHPREVQCVEATDQKLARAAMRSVRQYRFHPARKGGKVVATEMQQRIQFRFKGYIGPHSHPAVPDLPPTFPPADPSQPW